MQTFVLRHPRASCLEQIFSMLMIFNDDFLRFVFELGMNEASATSCQVRIHNFGIVLNIRRYRNTVRFATVFILEHCPRIHGHLYLHSDATCFSTVQSYVKIPSRNFATYSQHVRAKKQNVRKRSQRHHRPSGTSATAPSAWCVAGRGRSCHSTSKRSGNTSRPSDVRGAGAL